MFFTFDEQKSVDSNRYAILQLLESYAKALNKKKIDMSMDDSYKADELRQRIEAITAERDTLERIYGLIPGWYAPVRGDDKLVSNISNDLNKAKERFDRYLTEIFPNSLLHNEKIIHIQARQPINASDLMSTVATKLENLVSSYNSLLSKSPHSEQQGPKV